jgi:ABC-2 type transport system ATP-binding protein
MSEAAISVRGLRKSYGEHEAVSGIDFEVGSGEVFGFLGPNGAGKTTTIEILEGYRERSGGEVEVLGVDPGEPTRECSPVARNAASTSRSGSSATPT